MSKIYSLNNEIIYQDNNVEEKVTVEAAVKEGISLSGAELFDANLSGANLSDADLSGANLFRANLFSVDLSDADLSGANLFGAILSGAILSGADLSGANLFGAILSGAILSGADLSDANLYGAYFGGAVLRGTRGLSLERISPLAMLLDQPGQIRAYKLVDKDGNSPTAELLGYNKIYYQIGHWVEELDFDPDPSRLCSRGINLASLDWCIQAWKKGMRILVVEFTAENIVAIPLNTDGKFRVNKCKVVGEKDLVALGLIEKYE